MPDKSDDSDESDRIGLTESDRKYIAEFVIAEMMRRRDHKFRKEKELEWTEIDRQVALQPKKQVPRETPRTSAEKTQNWMPAGAFPSQANALEILADDAHRMVFAENEDWYVPTGVLTKAYAEQIEGLPIVTETEIGVSKESIDQQGLDMTVKAVIDHYHGLYNYRENWFQLLGEAIKYGTYVPRLRLVKLAAGTGEYRGENNMSQMVPMIVPASIRNVLLDDKPQWALHDSLTMGPSYIRRWWQSLPALKKAAKAGGDRHGWFPKEIESLVPQEKEGHKEQVEISEYEGDIFIPRAGADDLFLENVILTVAVGQGSGMIRARKSGLPFRSYFPGYYERHEAFNPYGTSPLTRGRSLQEMISEVANRATAVACLQAEPPVSYDDQDTALEAAGGPVIAPAAMWASNFPDRIKAHSFGDPGALLAMLSFFVVMHEETTKVNDPRRGAQGRSHTTAFAKDVEVGRSLLPTDSFANRVMQGPLLSSLYMEYEAIKSALRSERTIFVDSRGVRGHITISHLHLPDRVDFVVHGSRGLFSKRERQTSFMAFVEALMKIEMIEAQTGVPRDELKLRLAAEFGIEDVEELIAAGREAARAIAEQSGG